MAVSLLAENEVHGATLGYLSSRHHVVTFHGITESFHLSLPGSEGPERKWLFSTGERKRFDASGYLDLALSKDRLEEFRAGFIVLAGVAPEAGQRRAAEFLVSDWDRAIAMSDKAADGSIAFCEFVPHLNAALVERYGLAEGTFESRFHDVVDGLATVGVSNWPRFVTQLLRSGALDPQDTVLRLRTFNSKGLPRYLSLHLESPGDDFDRRGDVIHADKDSKAPGSYSLNDLVSRSQASLRDGNGITLVPAAPICYWANFAVGNVLGFLDGSVNYRLHRVARAMMSREMTNNPRPLTVAPYTSLVHHVPENPHRPYHGIEEVGNVLDFYTLPNLE